MTGTIRAMTDLADVLDGLEPLRGETWGRRLQRAREQRDLTLDGVVHLLGPTQLSASTLSRMESAVDAPRSAKARARAFLVLVLYGVDPRELGLDAADAPGLIDLRAVRTLGERGNLQTFACAA